MDIDLGDLNYLAVVAGIIINMALGALWYSPILFANSWMAATGITKEYIDEHKDQAMKGYAVSIVASIVFVLGLAVMVQVSGAADLAEGLAIGLIAGVGFVATTQGANYTFENRPPEAIPDQHRLLCRRFRHHRRPARCVGLGPVRR